MTRKKSAPSSVSQKIDGRIRHSDVMIAQAKCSLSTDEMRRYIGWSSEMQTKALAHPDEELRSPAQAIILRQLIHNPGLCVIPPKPTFDEVLQRINDTINVAEIYGREFGAINRESRGAVPLSAFRLMRLMGISSANRARMQARDVQSPSVTRQLQHIMRLMDAYGPQEGFARFVGYVREEAQSRGLTLREVMSPNAWKPKGQDAAAESAAGRQARRRAAAVAAVPVGEDRPAAGKRAGKSAAKKAVHRNGG